MKLIVQIGIVLALVLNTLLLPVASAQTQPTQPFTLQPGGTATITFEAYCTEFGKFFPESIKVPTGVAPDSIRAALAYIQQQGYSADGAKALEANFAIWQLAGATRATGGGTITKAVKDNAGTAPTNPKGTSILDAAKAGNITMTLSSWKAIGDKVQILSATDHFYGRGTLTIVNTSKEDLSLYMPIGTLFPGSEARLQVMGGYATDIQVKNPTATQLPRTGGGIGDSQLLVVAIAALLFAGVARLFRKQPINHKAQL
jgi:hypothetical protein